MRWSDVGRGGDDATFPVTIVRETLVEDVLTATSQTGLAL